MINMSLKHGLLGLLNYGSMSGYDLDKAFKDSLSFFWQAKTSQIYRELDTMERLGWLVSERIIQGDKPNKRLYSITEDGRQELLNWLTSPEEDIDNALWVKSAFLMRVFFAGETRVEQSIDLLRSYRDKCMQHSQRMNAAHGAIAGYGEAMGGDTKTLYWKIAALYGDTYYRAGIEWAEKAISILEGKAP
ncbi:MAG: PadR family transcriptional regulator [Clostridiales bacterium]|jgi:DNA-binding PadR family transcriptional regulator|nr:PadR family transcriptional regulator [Clostridiales bacterium]